MPYVCYCRPCKRKYDLAYKKKTKYKHKKKSRNALKEKIRDLKDKPCMDCGIKYPHYVMDFDHVRGIKLFDISQKTDGAINKTLEEIDKCDLVCSNCHRIRTHKRQNPD